MLSLVTRADRAAKEVFYTSEQRKSLSFQTDYDAVKASNFGGACLTLSGILQLVLAEHGIKTRLFQTQSFILAHAWLETDDGTVIDPTINQFPGKRKVPLYVGHRIKGIHPLPKPKARDVDYLGLKQFSEESYEILSKAWGLEHALSPTDIWALSLDVIETLSPHQLAA